MQGDDAEKKERIGVFGGTFDPVHTGHIRLAEFVLAQRIVDRILYVPAAEPPHKPGAMASFSHRVAMLKIAIAGRAAMAVSTIESQRLVPSYTVDCLRALQQEFPGTPLSFLLGADSLLELHHWYRFTELFHLADLIVVARSGLADNDCYIAIRKVAGDYIPDTAHRLWIRHDGAKIWYLTGFSSDVSSSSVRLQLASHQDPQGVDQAVIAHIQKHHLYQAGKNALHS